MKITQQYFYIMYEIYEKKPLIYLIILLYLVIKIE